MLRKIGTVRICRSIDDGGSSGLSDEQFDLMKDLINAPIAGEVIESEESDDDLGDSAPEGSVDAKDGEGDQAPETKTEEKQETDEEDSDVDPKDAAIEALRAQIIALTEATNVDPKLQKVATEVETEEKKAEKVVKDITEAFLTEEELDRLIDEPQLINVAIQRSQQAIVHSVGSIVQAEVQKQIMVSKAVSDFYTENNDLLPYSKFVQFVMGEVEKQNPSKTYGEIFTLTAQESRKRLGLAKVAAPQRNASANNGQQKPAFAGSKRGNSRPATSKELFDKNAQDILDLGEY